MKSEKVLAILLTFFISCSCLAVPVEIRYNTEDLGGGQWKYNYEVENISLTEQIEEFTIWFDYGDYDNLSIETPDPPAGGWDEMVVQPEPVLEDDGFYDALYLTAPIDIGESVSGFSVSFDWLGTGNPASQLYHIVDPEHYPDPVCTGYTVPEPGTCVLLLAGGLFLGIKKNRS